MLQYFTNLGERKRPERADAQRTDLRTGIPHFVDDLLNRAVDRAQRDDDGLGIVGAIRFHQPSRKAPEPRLERGGELRYQLERTKLLVMCEVTNFGECFRADHRAHA